MCSADCKSRFQCRYVLAVLGFIGFIFNYLLRVNINLVITSMTTTSHINQSINQTDNSNLINKEFFDWNAAIKNDVISSFYIGYIFLQVPGGRMAELFGGKKVLGLAIGLTAMLTLLIPTAAKQGGYGPDDYPYYLIIVRSLMGLCEGVTFPAVTSMLAQWAPLQDKAFLTTLIMSGSQVGTIIAFFISGVIVDSLGWEAVFYIQGSLAFIWVLFWMLIIHDTPDTHPYISETEKKYIQSGINYGDRKQSVPWRQIMKSLPFWAIFVANFCTNFGYHLLMTELPQYLKEIFTDYFTDSTTMGIWTGVPYACAWIASIVLSRLCDFLIKAEKISVKNARKLFSSIAFGGNILCLIVLAAVPTNDNPQLVLTLVTFTVCTTIGSAWFPGWLTNFQDIAPQFAGTILGLTNSISCTTAFIGPKIAGAILLNDPKDIDNWRYIWIMSSCILGFAGVFYVLFADGDVQPWSKQGAIENKEEKGDKEELKLQRKTTI